MKSLYLSLALILSVSIVNAQLEVNYIDEAELTEWIEGTDVTISNLQVQCDPMAIASFVNLSPNNGLEVPEGIILSTGPAYEAIGPNDLSSSTGALDNGVFGDIDLEYSASGFQVYDVCRLEFDLVPLHQFIIFNYAFGSEEYMEYAGTSFNDIFGFFVSGPGITGGSFSNGAKNYSLVPGTELPVAINNVNAEVNPEYYIDNGNGTMEPYLSDPMYLQYDGLTGILPGTVEVIPNETYHVKIAVADVSDSSLDSGVFLQKESFKSVSGVVGIPELNNLDITMYPNPAAEFLSIEGDDLRNATAYEILPIDGRTIAKSNITNSILQINVQDFESGVYFLKLTANGSELGVSTFVKE